MNEEQIKQKLEQKINVQEPIENIASINVTSEDEEVGFGDLPYDNIVLRSNVMDIFNIPMIARTSDTKIKIDYISKWAVENSSSNELIDILETLSRQERIMGIQMKPDRLERMYRYVKLNNQRKVIELQMRQLNG